MRLGQLQIRLQIFRRDSYAGDNQFPGVAGARVEQHFGLGSGEGHGEIRPHLHGGGNVHRHHFGTRELRVDDRDHLGVAALHRFTEAGAEQRVYDNGGVAVDRPGRIRDPDHLQAGDAGFQQASDDYSVSAVIAGAAEDHHALAPQRCEFRFEKLDYLGAGARHQHVRRGACGDGLAVGLTRLLYRQNLHAGTPVRSCSSFCRPFALPITMRWSPAAILMSSGGLNSISPAALRTARHDHVEIALYMDVGQRSVRE